MNLKRIKRQQQQEKNLKQIQMMIHTGFIFCVFLFCMTFYFNFENVPKNDFTSSNFGFLFSVLYFIGQYKNIWFHVCIFGLLWHLWHLAQLVHWLQHLHLQLKPKTYSQFWTFVYELLAEKLTLSHQNINTLAQESQSLQVVLEHIPYPLIELSNFDISNYTPQENINFIDFHINNCVIQWCNLAAAQLFNMKRRGFYDKKIDFLFQKKSFKIIHLNQLDLFSQHFFRRESEHFAKKQSTLYQQIAQTIILEGTNRFFLLLTPVIIAKRFFILIQDLSKHYEQQLYEKTLLSHISHELKTPIAVIQNGLETMNQEELGIIPAKDSSAKAIYDALMNLLFKETERMQELIHDLLEFQSLNTQQIQQEPLVLQHIIESSIETASYVGVKNPIIYEHHHTLNIRGSKKEWLSIFGNLLQNAQKYTQGTISIFIETNKYNIKINIQDQGEGIELEHLPFLFDPFYRIPAKNKPQGSGLGLAIVKKLVERQQGTIEVTSTKGFGSCFTITIPYS